MLLLILGILIWSAAHFLKRLAPERRAALGDRGRGLIAAGIGLGLVLMIFGYRMSPEIGLYYPPAWTVHLNNLLMFFAVVLFGAGSSKGRARSLMRHPMLTGVMVWALAHLLVNGDLASLLLFGGMGIWAHAEMRLINRAEPEWTRPEPGPITGDIRLFVIALVLYAVITAIHTWLGYWPFPR